MRCERLITKFKSHFVIVESLNNDSFGVFGFVKTFPLKEPIDELCVINTWLFSLYLQEVLLTFPL